MKVRGLLLVAILALGFITGCTNDFLESNDDVPASSAWGGRPRNVDDQFMSDDQQMSGDDQPGPGMSDMPYSPDQSSSGYSQGNSQGYSQESSHAPAEVPFDDTRKQKEAANSPANVGAY